MSHEIFTRVNSVAVVDNPKSVLNCYWSIPFRKHVRVTFTNESAKDLTLLTWQITYASTYVPQNIGYLHAQWRRATIAARRRCTRFRITSKAKAGMWAHLLRGHSYRMVDSERAKFSSR
jgi:hypothetical protein